MDIADWALVREQAVTGAMEPTKFELLIDRKGRAAAAAAKTEAATVAATADSTEPSAAVTTADKGSSVGKVIPVAGLRDLAEAIFDAGRTGIEVKRFKGLGEMNAEELWDTTMNPENRTLMRVTWDAASEAERLFSILMGENVEPRRRYIEDHALDVKNLDV